MNKLIKLFTFIILIMCVNKADAIIYDELADTTLKGIELEKPYQNLSYNYESFEKTAIPLKILTPVSTKKNDVYEGQELKFKVRRDVVYKNKTLFKQGDIFTARIETYITRGMNGIPASIIVDNFRKEGVDSAKIMGNYKKRGKNLTWFVLPLKWMLTPLPPTGSLTNFIIGGHAKITENDTVTIFYYPEWNVNL